MPNNLPASLHHIKENLILVSVKLFFGSIIIESLYAVFVYFFLFSPLGTPFQNLALPVLFFSQLVKFIIQIYFVLFITLSSLKSDYYLSEEEICAYSGVVWTDEEIYPLRAVKSIALRQSWLGKTLNYGNIVVEMTASGGYHKTLVLRGISDPKKYEHTLNELIKNPPSGAK